MEPSEYEKRAKKIADKIGIEIVCAYQGEQCPEWSDKSKKVRTPATCKECGDVHGDKFRVTIKRKEGKGSVSFDFWASWADCYVEIKPHMIGSPREFGKVGLSIYHSNMYHAGQVVQREHKPGYYDILACVYSDMCSSTDPDEIYDEFGEMKPSRANAIAAHARKLQKFFTDDEREQLSEVDQ